MTLKTQQFKNAMRVYTADMQYRSFGLSEFKLMFCIYNKLHLEAEFLS